MGGDGVAVQILASLAANLGQVLGKGKGRVFDRAGGADGGGPLRPHVGLASSPASTRGRHRADRGGRQLVRSVLASHSSTSPVRLPRSYISASIFVVGCLTGSLVGGWQCERFGRRNAMLIDCVIMLAGMVGLQIILSCMKLSVDRDTVPWLTATLLLTRSV